MYGAYCCSCTSDGVFSCVVMFVTLDVRNKSGAIDNWLRFGGKIMNMRRTVETHNSYELQKQPRRHSSTQGPTVAVQQQPPFKISALWQPRRVCVYLCVQCSAGDPTTPTCLSSNVNHTSYTHRRTSVCPGNIVFRNCSYQRATPQNFRSPTSRIGALHINCLDSTSTKFKNTFCKNAW